jgi:hypothetical protein
MAEEEVAEVNRNDTVRSRDDAGPPSGEKSAQRPVSTEEKANLSIKVSRRQRLHWLIEAKRQGTSLTAAVIEALNARFGEPE